MPDHAGIAAERLAWMMTSWQSMEIEVQEHNDNDPFLNAEFTSYDSTHRYIETAAGYRAYTETTTPEPSRITHVQARYTDGKRSAKFDLRDTNDPERSQVIIRRVFGREESGCIDVPQPLVYFYVGLEPLHKALARSEYLGTSRHLDRDCDMFLFRDLRFYNTSYDYVYWLDRATSIPLKVRGYTSSQMREADVPQMEWSAETIEKIGGRWFPTKSSCTSWTGKAPNPAQKIASSRLQVKSLVFDKTYDKAEFWPAINEHTTVFDEIGKTSQFPRKKGLEKVKTQTISDPIRAIDPEPGWPMMSGAAILLGITSILVAAILRRRAGA
jgi:hypothetical protein